MHDISWLKNKKIAITGATGFIGGAFQQLLKKNKIPFTILEGDVRLASTWDRKFNLLYHFAAAAPQKAHQSPEEIFSVNVLGVVKALEACRRNKAHFIFPSTSGVYASLTKAGLREDSPIAPPSVYTRSKFFAEIMCAFYAQKYHVPSTILRLFNVYGVGQRAPFIIPYLIECAFAKKKAKVKHPNSIRDYIYLQDVIEAFLNAAFVKGSCLLCNIGLGKPYSVLEVMKMIEKLSGRKLDYETTSGSIDPQPVIYANIDRAAHALKWRPHVGLNEGLNALIAAARHKRN